MSLSQGQKIYLQARKNHAPVGIDETLMKSLEHNVLTADVTFYTKEKLKVLFEVIRNCPELVEVKIICGNSPTIKKRFSSLQMENAIVSTAQGNRFLCKNIHKLFSYPECCTIHLSLIGIKFFEPGAKALSEALSMGMNLRKLRLHKCEFEPKTFEAIVHGICESRIQNLDFSSCSLDNRRGSGICEILRSHATQRRDQIWCRTLRQRDDRDLTDDEIRQLGILVIDLSDNKLGDGFCEMLASELSIDSWLGAMNLYGNPIGKAGAQILFKVLQHSNLDLAILNMRECYPDAAPVVVKIDELLRARSLDQQHGIINLVTPKSCAIISNAIWEWGCTHQIPLSIVELLNNGADFDATHFAHFLPSANISKVSQIGSDPLGWESAAFMHSRNDNDLENTSTGNTIETDSTATDEPSGKKKSKKKSKYKKRTLSKAAQERLLQKMTAEFARQLSLKFQEYGSLPEGSDRAILEKTRKEMSESLGDDVNTLISNDQDSSAPKLSSRVVDRLSQLWNAYEEK